MPDQKHQAEISLNILIIYPILYRNFPCMSILFILLLHSNTFCTSQTFYTRLYFILFVNFFLCFLFYFLLFIRYLCPQQDPSNVVEKCCRPHETSSGPNRNAFAYWFWSSLSFDPCHTYHHFFFPTVYHNNYPLITC